MPLIDQQALDTGVLAMISVARTASHNGPVIDTAGFFCSTYFVQTATVTTADGSNTITFKLQHGNLADGSDMVDVPAADITGDTVIINATTGKSNQVIGKIGHVPQTVQGLRYERLVATVTGTVNAVFGATAVLSGVRKIGN